MGVNEVFILDFGKARSRLRIKGNVFAMLGYCYYRYTIFFTYFFKIRVDDGCQYGTVGLQPWR